jgi:hypothetical protein
MYPIPPAISGRVKFSLVNYTVSFMAASCPIIKILEIFKILVIFILTKIIIYSKIFVIKEICMEFTVRKHPGAKELTSDIKGVLNSYIRQIPYLPFSKKLSREELRQYLGEMLDDDNNRAIAFKNGSLCKTLRRIFTQVYGGEKRKTLFLTLLLEYDKEVYGNLLADMINQAGD